MNTKKCHAQHLLVLLGLVKCSISKVVANELGYLYIDTGSMYRGVTWVKFSLIVKSMLRSSW